MGDETVNRKVGISDLSTIIQSLEIRLRAIHGVLGVGFGWKDVHNRLTDIPAFRIYVAEKVPIAFLHPTEVIPHEISGIATDVLKAETVVAISTANDLSNCLPAAGATISNLRSVLESAAHEDGAAGIGAIGFYAAARRAVDWNDLVFVSNRHVLLANGGRRGDLIYHPQYSLAGGKYHFRRDQLNPFAEILDEGLEGGYRYRYAGEPEQEYFIDCATARVVKARKPRIRSYADLKKFPMLFKGIGRLHQLDTVAGRQLRVFKVGRDGHRVAGRVLDANAVVVTADRQQRRNNIYIRAEQQFNGNSRPFADEGDSGSLIVDELNRAVGLLWGKSLQHDGDAFACHIHPVLDRLQVTPLRYELRDDLRDSRDPLLSSEMGQQ